MFFYRCKKCYFYTVCKCSEHTKILYYIIVIYNGYSIHLKKKRQATRTEASQQHKDYNIYAIAILFVLALYIALAIVFYFILIIYNIVICISCFII